VSSVRPEYPRPHFDRSHAWLSLNGEWDFARDPAGTASPERMARAEPERWSERIVVPFAWETEASAVNAQWLEHGWYRRTLPVPADWAGQRVVLHFGAVHHHAQVWVNGTQVGEHEGGYTPFEFDITEALGSSAAEGTAEATLLVKVWAPLDKREIVHGKQRSVPRDVYDICAFTPSSGIWQPVWLEARPATYLADVALTPADSLDAIVARIAVAGPSAQGARITLDVAGQTLQAIAELSDASAASDTSDTSRASVSVTVPIADPRLWTPEDPHLYAVHVALESADGADEVGASTGLRRIETSGAEILLNGRRVYLRGVLDQGYWPRTGITAPDDEAFVKDIVLAREAGFNLVRKHLKLEDPRFLHHADRLGMLVWAEPASTGVCTPESVARFEAQIEPMVRRDGNHPSIVVWGLYNEEWGLDWDVAGVPEKQDAVRRAFDLLKSLDATRPAVDDSGWSHVKTDLVDWHIYDETPRGWAEKVRALMEGGVTSFPVNLGPEFVVDKHLMAEIGAGAPADVPNLNSEFGGGVTSVDRGWNLRWQTGELRRHDRLSGYIWTELYDIEHETAGIYAFDRTLKDTGANPPALTNAGTVLIPDVDPIGPGRDLIAAESGEVAFDVRISHHGPEPLEAHVVPVWSTPLALEPESIATAAATAPAENGATDPVKAHPFRLTDPIRIATALPEGAAAARLHLLLVAAGHVVGRTVLDVLSGK
jgi:hypothetical protein